MGEYYEEKGLIMDTVVEHIQIRHLGGNSCKEKVANNFSHPF